MRLKERKGICERGNQSRIQGFETVWKQKATESKRPRERSYNHTKSIASSNKFDTDLNKARPPSEGIYAATASATSLSIVSGDINRVWSPPCMNRA